MAAGQLSACMRTPHQSSGSLAISYLLHQMSHCLIFRVLYSLSLLCFLLMWPISCSAALCTNFLLGCLRGPLKLQEGIDSVLSLSPSPSPFCSILFKICLCSLGVDLNFHFFRKWRLELFNSVFCNHCWLSVDETIVLSESDNEFLRVIGKIPLWQRQIFYFYFFLVRNS